jgi:hypothetical protein
MEYAPNPKNTGARKMLVVALRPDQHSSVKMNARNTISSTIGACVNSNVKLKANARLKKSKPISESFTYDSIMISMS